MTSRHSSTTALTRRLHRYTSPRLLAIDEVGYLSYDARYADLLFEVVTRRYEQQRSILLTTNKAFGECYRWSVIMHGVNFLRGDQSLRMSS